MPTEGSQQTFKRFLHEYSLLESSVLNSDTANPIIAERLMTWGNILTHKANLLDE